MEILNYNNSLSIRTFTLDDIRYIFETYLLNGSSDICLYIDKFEELENIFKGFHSKIFKFLIHHKIYIILKNYDKYLEIKKDCKRNIYDKANNFYLRGLKNYFEDDWYKKYNVEPIQNFSHLAGPFIYSENGIWLNWSRTFGEDYNPYEGCFTTSKNEELNNTVKHNFEMLMDQSKPLTYNEIEGIDYTKEERENLFENTGCLVYFIPVILISLMFLVL